MGKKPLIKNYYDKYKVVGAAYGNTNLPVSSSTNTRGRLMQVEKYIDGKEGIFTESYAYDDKGRILFKATQAPGSLHRVVSEYDFGGKLITENTKLEINTSAIVYFRGIKRFNTEDSEVDCRGEGIM